MSRESKHLSLILRYEPELMDHKVDAQGWARTDEFLRQLKRAGRGISEAHLLEIVETRTTRSGSRSARTVGASA